MSFSLSSAARPGEMPLLFLPGWGFDARLVALYRLFPGRCLILPDSFIDPVCFAADLAAFLRSRRIAEIAVLGWSMGAQLGLDLCLSHARLVRRLDLVAMRSRWPQQEIVATRTAIAADLPACMRDFYRRCFLGCKRPYHDFVSKLQDDYLRRLDREILMAGLDYLQDFTMPARLPGEVAVRIIHGRRDMVAPLEEMPRLPGAASEVFTNAGHMVLLDHCGKQQDV